MRLEYEFNLLLFILLESSSQEKAKKESTRFDEEQKLAPSVSESISSWWIPTSAINLLEFYAS